MPNLNQSKNIISPKPIRPVLLIKPEKDVFFRSIEHINLIYHQAKEIEKIRESQRGIKQVLDKLDD